jgi:helix-turn-helix protein
LQKTVQRMQAAGLSEVDICAFLGINAQELEQILNA